MAAVFAAKRRKQDRRVILVCRRFAPCLVAPPVDVAKFGWKFAETESKVMEDRQKREDFAHTLLNLSSPVPGATAASPTPGKSPSGMPASMDSRPSTTERPNRDASPVRKSSDLGKEAFEMPIISSPGQPLELQSDALPASSAIIPLNLASALHADKLHKGQYLDITDYLNLPQSQAADKLGIPTSTLSKRWKEAAQGRKWPFRTIAKLDKEITTLMYNIPADAPQMPPEIEQTLGHLLRLKQQQLTPVVIRLYD